MIDPCDLFAAMTDDTTSAEAVRTALIEILFDRMPVGIAVFDRDLKLCQCNPAWVDFVERYAPLAIDRSEVQPGVGLLALFPHARQRFEPFFDRVFAGEVVREEGVRLESDGIVSYWDMLLTPLIRDEVVHGFVNVAIDASDRVFAYQMLEIREAQYRSIYEATSDGLVIQTLTGEIIEANPAACAMLKYDYPDIIGRAARDLVHPAYRHLYDQTVREVGAGATMDTQMVVLRHDHQPLDVEVRATAFSYRGATHMLSVVRDVTERVQAYNILEQAVDERTRELSTLLEVSRNIAETLDLQPLLRAILDQVKEVIEYSGAAIYLFDDENTLELLLYTGPIPQAQLQKVWQLDENPSINEVIMTHKPVVIGDVRAETPLARAHRQSLGANIDYVTCWMGVPLIARQRMIGLIGFEHTTASFYMPHHSTLALTFANQAAIAIENTRLRERAKEAAVAAERNRLARELHDAVTQTLFSASLIADVLPRLWSRNADEAEKRLAELRQLTRGALAEMRTLLLELRPAALADAELGDLLQQLCDSLSGRARIPVKLTISGERSLTTDVKLVFYRVAQEAMNNIFKHAGANTVYVALDYRADRVRLTVADDGSGFDPALVSSEHMGLNIMRERIDSIGGTFDLESKFGSGTSIRVIWRQHEIEGQWDDGDQQNTHTDR